MYLNIAKPNVNTVTENDTGVSYMFAGITLVDASTFTDIGTIALIRIKNVCFDFIDDFFIDDINIIIIPIAVSPYMYKQYAYV